MLISEVEESEVRAATQAQLWVWGLSSCYSASLPRAILGRAGGEESAQRGVLDPLIRSPDLADETTGFPVKLGKAHSSQRELDRYDYGGGNLCTMASVPLVAGSLGLLRDSFLHKYLPKTRSPQDLPVYDRQLLLRGRCPKMALEFPKCMSIKSHTLHLTLCCLPFKSCSQHYLFVYRTELPILGHMLS